MSSVCSPVRPSSAVRRYGSATSAFGALVAKNGRLECGLYVQTSQSALIFQKLEAERETIETELGVPEEVDWNPNPEKLASRIGIHRPANLADRDSLPELYEWLKTGAERFKEVFAGRVREMELPDPDAAAVGQSPAVNPSEARAAAGAPPAPIPTTTPEN